MSSRLILGPEIVDGVAAERLGLVQWSVPAGALGAAAADIARRYAALLAHAAAAAKACIAAAANPGTAGFDAEIEQTGALLQSAVTRGLVGDFLARSNR